MMDEHYDVGAQGGGALVICGMLVKLLTVSLQVSVNQDDDRQLVTTLRAEIEG